MTRKIRTEEEIFLDKLKKMERFKRDTDKKLLELGKKFFEEYNSIDYKTVHKRIEDKYKNNPFERRKYLTKEQEDFLYEKFNTHDLEKIMIEISKINLDSTTSSKEKENVISDADVEDFEMLKLLKKGYEVSDLPTLIQKIKENIIEDLKNDD